MGGSVSPRGSLQVIMSGVTPSFTPIMEPPVSLRALQEADVKTEPDLQEIYGVKPCVDKENRSRSRQSETPHLSSK